MTTTDDTTTANAGEPWALVTRVQAGDREAFGLIYDRYHRQVLAYVSRGLRGNPATAEDITADVFVRALKGIDRLTWQGRDLGAWLVTIARHLLADHYRSGRNRLELTVGDDSLAHGRPDTDRLGQPELATIEALTNEDLLDAVRELNAEQRQVVVLRFLEQMSITETAQAMGKNEGAVKALQFRAVQSLRRIQATPKPKKSDEGRRPMNDRILGGDLYGPAITPELPSTPAAGSVARWDSWLCETCWSRYLSARPCCGVEAAPVTVTITRRDAPVDLGGDR